MQFSLIYNLGNKRFKKKLDLTNSLNIYSKNIYLYAVGKQVILIH